MERRDFLAGVFIAGTAGCTADEERTQATTTTTRTTTEPSDETECKMSNTTESDDSIDGEVFRRVELIDVDVPPTEEIEFDVEVTPNVITDEQTVEVRIAFQNRADQTRSFGFGRPPFVSKQSTESPGWILFGEDDSPTRRSEDCWYAEDDNNVAYESVDILDVYLTDPCEVISHTFELWSLQADPCMPTGEYRFQGEYASDAESDDEEFHTWGFDVRISKPE